MAQRGLGYDPEARTDTCTTKHVKALKQSHSINTRSCSWEQEEVQQENDSGTRTQRTESDIQFIAFVGLPEQRNPESSSVPAS